MPGLTTEDLVKKLNEQHQAVQQMHQEQRTANETLSRRVEAVETHTQDLGQALAARRGIAGAGRDQVQSLGQQFINSAAWTANAPQLSGQRGKIQAAITTGTAGGLVAPDVRTDPVMKPRRRMFVRSLIAPGSTNSNMVQYPRQTVQTLNAAVVSEGATKPESNIEFAQVDAPVRTIAHWTKASVQVYDDAPQLASIIDGELTYGLDLAEEMEMLYGDGTGQHLFGIIPQAEDFDPPFYVANATAYDVLLQAIGQCQLALFPASGVVLNDMDWLQMQSIKDSQGRYIGGGPFGSIQALAWQVPVVGTPLLPRGDFLVGAFALGAQVFDRMETTVLVSSEDQDNFVRNLLTIRAERREALAVQRPQAFVTGELPAIASEGSGT